MLLETQGKKNGPVSFFIDDEDADSVIQAGPWHYSPSWNYIHHRKTKDNGKWASESLHIFLLGNPPKGMVIDHINRNRLDNRKCNLRVVDKRTNALNSKISIRNTSGFRGVRYDKRAKRWHAVFQISANKKCHVGYFDSAEEAARAREIAVKNASTQ